MVKYSKWQCKCGFVNESKYCLMCGNLNNSTNPINDADNHSNNVNEVQENVQSITSKAKQELGNVTDNIKENIKNAHLDKKAEEFKNEALRTAGNVSDTINAVTKQANTKITLVKENVNAQLNEIDVDSIKKDINDKTQQMTEKITSVKNNVVSHLNDVDIEEVKHGIEEQVQHGSQVANSFTDKVNKKLVGIVIAVLIFCIGGYFGYYKYQESSYIDKCIEVKAALSDAQISFNDINSLDVNSSSDVVNTVLEQLKQTSSALGVKLDDLSKINVPSSYVSENNKLISLLKNTKNELDLAIIIMDNPLSPDAKENFKTFNEQSNLLKQQANDIHIGTVDYNNIINLIATVDKLDKYVSAKQKQERQRQEKEKAEAEKKELLKGTKLVYTDTATNIQTYVQEDTAKWIKRGNPHFIVTVKRLDSSGRLIANETWEYGSDEGYLFTSMSGKKGTSFAIARGTATADQGKTSIVNRPDLIEVYRWCVNKFGQGDTSNPSAYYWR